MEDVARAAGVSMITVSRALNAPGKLAPATLARVRAAIERLRYVPNLTAGSLASNRSRIIAAIVPTIANSIFSDTVDGLARLLARHRYQLLLGQTQYRQEEEKNPSLRHDSVAYPHRPPLHPAPTELVSVERRIGQLPPHPPSTPSRPH